MLCRNSKQERNERILNIILINCVCTTHYLYLEGIPTVVSSLFLKKPAKSLRFSSFSIRMLDEGMRITVILTYAGKEIRG